MLIQKFFQKFPDEQSCRLYLKEKRESVGVRCDSCNSKKLEYHDKFHFWTCKKCGTTKNLKSGTLFESTKLPLTYWFIGIYLMMTTKRSFSAMELQRRLGHKRYEPIWYMLNKIRTSIGNIDRTKKLSGVIQYSISDYFVLDEYSNTRNEQVLTLVENEIVGKQKSEKNNYTLDMERLKVRMIVLDNDIENVVKNNITKKGVLIENDKEDIIIQNSKMILYGIHSNVAHKYLQTYLDEFTYKLNHRNLEMGIFDDFMTESVKAPWYV